MKTISGLENSNRGAVTNQVIAVRDSSGWVSCSHMSELQEGQLGQKELEQVLQLETRKREAKAMAKEQKPQKKLSAA